MPGREQEKVSVFPFISFQRQDLLHSVLERCFNKKYKLINLKNYDYIKTNNCKSTEHSETE